MKYKECTGCHKYLSSASFSTYQSSSRGKRSRSRCKTCELKRIQKYNETHRESKRAGYRKLKEKKYKQGGDILLEYLFLQRLGALRATTKNLNLPKLNITAKYLVKIYNQQNGKCFYTGKKMIYGHRLGKQLPNSMSIDRVNPKQGYVAGNIVLCINDVNTTKGNRSLKEFKKWINLLYTRSKNWYKNNATVK